MPQAMSVPAVSAQPVPIGALDAAFLQPFLAAHGAIPPEQHPVFAPVINAGVALKCFRFVREGKVIGYAIVKLRQYILADVYFGPVVLDSKDYKACIAALKPALRRQARLMLRIIPPRYAADVDGYGAQFNWATIVLDISRSREDLLRSFSVNHRQSIGKALKAGITVKPLPVRDSAAWLSGYINMFRRRGIAKVAEDAGQVLAAMTALSGAPGDSVFILAAYLNDGSTVAGGGIFLCSGDTCSYYLGFSEKTDPPVPVLHLLLLEAMLAAASRGCRLFDLYGYSLAGDDAQLKAINDFKRWFRGELQVYPGTVLLPLYAVAAPLIKWLHRKGKL